MRHPAWVSSNPTNRHQRARDAVQRIASTLGCAAETLTHAASLETYPDDAAELVRLWFKIEDPVARSRVLAEVRKAASR